MIDADTFSAALRPLLPRSAGYARSLLGEQGQAQDVVQQAALKAWEKRAIFDQRQPFRPWWYAILRNQCLDVLRHRKHMPASTDIDAAGLAVPCDESALDRIALERAMTRLTDMHREILTLRYYGDLDYEALAQVLAIPEGTVMSRLHLARKALALLVTKEDP